VPQTPKARCTPATSASLYLFPTRASDGQAVSLKSYAKVVARRAWLGQRKAMWTLKILGETSRAGKPIGSKRPLTAARVFRTFLKQQEVQYHHEVYNQFQWNLF